MNKDSLLNSSSSHSYVYKWINKPERGSGKCLKQPRKTTQNVYKSRRNVEKGYYLLITSLILKTSSLNPELSTIDFLTFSIP